MTPLAHIAGVPVEESVLAFAPAVAAAALFIRVEMRAWLRRR